MPSLIVPLLAELCTAARGQVGDAYVHYKPVSLAGRGSKPYKVEIL